MAELKRALSPKLNATGIGSSIAAVYAAAVVIWNATHNHAPVDPQVIVAGVTALLFLYARFKVTPVADPKTSDGTPLVPAIGDVTGATGEPPSGVR